MIYIIDGDEKFLIKNKINEIILKNNDALITKIDCLSKDFNANEIVDACTNVGIFNNRALVLVKDPPFLIKKDENNEYLNIVDYCLKPIYESDLVLYTYEDSFNERLKVFKEISSNAKVFHCKKLDKNGFYTYAKNLINKMNLNITKEAINYLINNINFDLDLLNRNIKILSLFPDRIDENVLMKLVSLSDEENVFNLINALTSKNITLSFKYANKILANDDNILGLIALLANQLRYLYTVSYYLSVGKSKNEIMNVTKTKNSYRLEKAIETLRSINEKDIMKLLSDLSDLNYKMKSNYELSDQLKLELFIINLIK